jgi:hypothetical protein
MPDFRRRLASPHRYFHRTLECRSAHGHSQDCLSALTANAKQRRANALRKRNFRATHHGSPGLLPLANPSIDMDIAAPPAEKPPLCHNAPSRQSAAHAINTQ